MIYFKHGILILGTVIFRPVELWNCFTSDADHKRNWKREHTCTGKILFNYGLRKKTRSSRPKRTPSGPGYRCNTQAHLLSHLSFPELVAIAFSFRKHESLSEGAESAAATKTVQAVRSSPRALEISSAIG